jgi:CRP/FNR family transcriptional regulator
VSIKKLSQLADDQSPWCSPEHSYLYKDLTQKHIDQLDNIASPVHLQANEYLMHQHSDAHHVYNLVSGNLLVERIASTGRRQVLAFVFPGDLLGFPHNNFFEFSVTALTSATVASYHRKEFLRISDDIPELKHNMEQISSNVLASALDQVFALGQKKAHERICFLLKQLLQRQSGAVAEDLVLPMTRQDMADYLGLTIETVSRAFAKLKTEKIIDVHHINHIEILDLEQLEEFACAE